MVIIPAIMWAVVNKEKNPKLGIPDSRKKMLRVIFPKNYDNLVS